MKKVWQSLQYSCCSKHPHTSKDRKHFHTKQHKRRAFGHAHAGTLHQTGINRPKHWPVKNTEFVLSPLYNAE